MFVESEKQNCCDTKDYDFNYIHLAEYHLVFFFLAAQFPQILSSLVRE